MTTEECVRKLAEALEPKPAPLTIYSTELISPKGFWAWNFDDSADYGWQPISPLESADASERLLEAMKLEEPSINYNADLEKWEFMLLNGRDWSEAPELASHADRRAAIFLSALKWKNIEIPEELK